MTIRENPGDDDSEAINPEMRRPNMQIDDGLAQFLTQLEARWYPERRHGPFPSVEASGGGAALKHQGQLIAPEEFCTLLLSRQPLERCDVPDQDLRGLLNESSGELFVTRASDLLRLTWERSSPPVFARD